MSAHIVTCTRCERIYPYAGEATVLIPGVGYICDECRAMKDEPRAWRNEHIEIIFPWGPARDRTDQYLPGYLRGAPRCPSCKTPMWCVTFATRIPREMLSESGALNIMPAGTVLTRTECPNPDCSLGWGKLQDHGLLCRAMAPPWSHIDFDRYPALNLIISGEEVGLAYHQLWWKESKIGKRVPERGAKSKSGKGIRAR